MIEVLSLSIFTIEAHLKGICNQVLRSLSDLGPGYLVVVTAANVRTRISLDFVLADLQELCHLTECGVAIIRLRRTGATSSGRLSDVTREHRE
jgi:hypothetical protein